jgi:hypothetical protein
VDGQHEAAKRAAAAAMKASFMFWNEFGFGLATGKKR